LIDIRFALAVALAALTGCEDKAPSGEAPSRVNGAKTTPRQGATVEAFCDVYATPETAKPMTWPALVEAAPRPAAGWRWINIWATWCKPCVDEMPRIVKWQAKLGTLDLAFVAVDEAADDIAEFQKSHPGMPVTLRLADSKSQDAWYQQLGLQGAPPIPIHVFVDPQQRVRCVRAGGVRDQDFPMIEKLLAR